MIFMILSSLVEYKLSSGILLPDGADNEQTWQPTWGQCAYTRRAKSFGLALFHKVWLLYGAHTSRFATDEFSDGFNAVSTHRW